MDERKNMTSKIVNIQIIGILVRESRKFGDKQFSKKIDNFPKLRQISLCQRALAGDNYIYKLPDKGPGIGEKAIHFPYKFKQQHRKLRGNGEKP